MRKLESGGILLVGTIAVGACNRPGVGSGVERFARGARRYTGGEQLGREPDVATSACSCRVT